MSFINTSKHFFRDLFQYPTIAKRDTSYDTYWERRDLNAPFNAFQKKRAELIMKMIPRGCTMLDLGCGDGRFLAYYLSNKAISKAIGVDASSVALNVARDRGIETIQCDLNDRGTIPSADVVLLLEVIEHVSDSEDLLAWALGHANKLLIFSVPNTGFVFHRLRLLFGRFPLQWRAHPSEHVRFWTVRDMKWWLKEMGITDYELQLYEGIPLLNKLWPSLFAAGIMIVLRRSNTARTS